MTKRRAIKIVCGVVVAIIAVGLLMPFTVATRSPKTCTLCRAERIDRTFLGYRWQSYRDTKFSAWYGEHRQAHQHEWGRLTCTRDFSVFGATTFFGCGPRHLICDIPPDTLRQFVERADANTLTTLFLGITSTNRDAQRQAVQLAWDRLLEER